MLPLKCRLKKRADIDRVFKKGKAFNAGFLILKALPNDLSWTRVAFSVSLKVSQKAVARNKIKRRLSEIARAVIINLRTPSDVVFIALPEIKEKSVKEIKELVEKVFPKCSK
ncbi:MAG: ribonuclease P protein component [bacterium]